VFIQKWKFIEIEIEFAQQAQWQVACWNCVPGGERSSVEAVDEYHSDEQEPGRPKPHMGRNSPSLPVPPKDSDCCDKEHQYRSKQARGGKVKWPENNIIASSHQDYEDTDGCEAKEKYSFAKKVHKPMPCHGSFAPLILQHLAKAPHELDHIQ
jgi:hypothetical protein